MSGAEVILGVIPILVEVAEYSHTLYQQFKRWRKYVSELGEFQDELYCYQCVFRKDCSLLLRAVTTTAEFDWIRERDVTKLENPELERKLMSYLDDQYFYCGVLMEKIKKELDVLNAKSQRFQDAITVSESAQNDRIERRTWRSIRAKAEFSITGPSLNEKLATLKKHSDIFRIIREQARDQAHLEGQSQLAPMPNLMDAHSIPAPDDSILEKITSVQTAANKLHNALLDSCTAQNEAAVYLRLKMQHRDGTELAKVNFDLRILPVLRDDSKSSRFPPKLRTYELAFNNSNTRYAEPSVEPLHELPNLRKRRRQSLSILSDVKRVKTNDSENDLSRLSIEDDAPLENRRHTVSTESLSTWYHSSEWHGEQTRIGAQSSHPTEHEGDEECLQLAKIVQDLGHQVSVPFDLPPPTTLADQISNWPPINHNHTYLPHEILFLAKHIALSVLQFHATPFLPENWTSQCIALFDTGGRSTNKRRPFTDPHLKFLIPHQLKQDNEFEPATSHIRNSYIFTLGIILIELAHQTPWQRLKDENYPDEDVTKFGLVDRFAVEMITLYGKSYTKIVQKCINCDFGEGKDLRNSTLRWAFYRDVVCVLDNLEQRFAELHKER